jgi:hypothetical protein
MSEVTLLKVEIVYIKRTMTGSPIDRHRYL